MLPPWAVFQLLSCFQGCCQNSVAVHCHSSQTLASPLPDFLGLCVIVLQFQEEQKAGFFRTSQNVIVRLALKFGGPVSVHSAHKC